jgi:hypothetical protein
MTTKEFMESDADGAYIEDDNTIIVRITNDEGIIGIDEWETLVHEVQHAIQHYEGFTTGASESFVRRNAHKILRAEEKKAKPLHDKMYERESQLADEMREEVYANLPKSWSKRKKEAALANAVDKAKFSDEAFESIRQQWLPYANRIKTLKILTGDPFYRNRLEDPMVIWDLYKSYAGEVEARNAVNRMYLHDYERAEKTLEETEGTPRELQIAIEESAGIAEARKNKSDYYKEIPQTEYTVLATDLFDKFGSKSVFGCIGNTANYYYLCYYFGDSKHPKVRAIFKIDANDETRRAFDSEVYRKGGFSPSDIDAILEESWNRGTSGSWDFGDSENRGEYHKDELVDSRQSQEGNNERGNSGANAQNRWTSIKSGYNGSSKPRVIFVSESELKSFNRTDDTDGLLFRSADSPITPEMDAEYLAAVEAGDMETAQRMVIEAAKLAMPNTKVVDENGNPKIVYHESPYGGIKVFNHKEDKSTSGLKEFGTYFATNRNLAEMYRDNRQISKDIEQEVTDEIYRLRAIQERIANSIEYDAIEREIRDCKIF